jgi:hypothetical protein
MLDYYVNNVDWDEERAVLLHDLLQQFATDGGVHPNSTSDAADKLDAWVDFGRWVRANPGKETTTAKSWWAARQSRTLPPSAVEVARLYNRMISWTRCSVGVLDLRSAELDSAARTASVASYFLARVSDDSGEWLEVGRMQAAVCHVPPGPNDPGRAVTFLRAKWLIPANPRLTPRSKLPIVVLPTSKVAYLCDDDINGFLTEVWAAVDIEPVPVCLLPLDEAHDIPQDIEIRSAGLGADYVNAGLGRYLDYEYDDEARGVDPKAHMDGATLRLAAVWFPESDMAERFIRGYDTVEAEV